MVMAVLIIAADIVVGKLEVLVVVSKERFGLWRYECCKCEEEGI